MKLKNLAKIFSRDKEAARDSTTVDHNMVPNSTPVNTDLIGASVGGGLHLANGILSADVESAITQSSLNLNVEDVDNRIYHITQGGAVAMEIPSLAANRILTFEVIVDLSSSTTLNFTATVGGNAEEIVWLDTPDFAQGAGSYFCAFRYYPSVGIMGNLYWKQDEESSSSSFTDSHTTK